MSGTRPLNSRHHRRSQSCTALSEGSDSADSATVPCGSPRSCCHSPWLPSIPDDSNKIPNHHGPCTRHYGPLRFSVFTQSDNYCKAPLNHIIRRWQVEIWTFVLRNWMGAALWHCYPSRSAASSRRGRPSLSRLGGWRVNQGQRLMRTSASACAHPAPFKGLLRNLASAPPSHLRPAPSAYSIPGSICHPLAAFQWSEAHSVSLLSRQTADWQNKRQQLQFITSFIIQNPT